MAINPQAVRGPVTAVPVVAGKGVRLREDVENNRVVAEADETVLWEGTGSANFALSESVANFDRIRVVMSVSNGTQTFQNSIHEFSAAGDYLSICDIFRYPANSNYPVYEFRWGASIANGTTITSIYSEMYWRAKDSYSGGLNTSVDYYPIKIVGINRVASA